MPNKKYALRLTVIILALPTIWACNKFGSSTSEVTIAFNAKGEAVAKVGDMVVTKEAIINRFSPHRELVTRFNSGLEEKIKLVDTEVKREVMLQEAIKQGYLNREDVQREIKQLLVEKWSRNEGKQIDASIHPSEEDIQAYYDEHSDLFHQPEKMRVDYMLIPFGDNKAAALKKAKDVLKRLSASEKTSDKKLFSTIADETTPAETPSADKPGETIKRNTFRSRAQTEAEFGKHAAEALWTLEEKRQVSSVIEGDKGFYIFNKLGIKPAVEKDLESVKANITKRITAEKRKEAFTKRMEDLKKAYPITIYEDRLSKLDLALKP
jgi:parvulin-like peptidyl-prolyl isomerase